MENSIPRAVKMASIHRNDNQDVVMTFKGENDIPYDVTLDPSLIGRLVVSLLSFENSVDHGLPVNAQLAVLSGVHTGVSPEGHPVLFLILENSVYFPVVFDRRNIPSLQSALSEVAAATTPKSDQRH